MDMDMTSQNDMPVKRGSLELTIENRIENLPTVIDQVEAFADQHALLDDERFALTLCMDELISNIVGYAFTDDETHMIDISIDLLEHRLDLRIGDDGFPFDPFTDAPAPELDGPLRARRIGGLGLHMIKAAMDHWSYRRIGTRNEVTLSRGRPKGTATGHPAR